MNMIKIIVSTALISCLISGSGVCNAALDAEGKNDGIGDRITLNFRESSIQEVFDVLSRKDKINIILGKGVTGNVSVNLYDITVNEAVYRVGE